MLRIRLDANCGITSNVKRHASLIERFNSRDFLTFAQWNGYTDSDFTVFKNICELNNIKTPVLFTKTKWKKVKPEKQLPSTPDFVFINWEGHKMELYL